MDGRVWREQMSGRDNRARVSAGTDKPARIQQIQREVDCIPSAKLRRAAEIWSQYNPDPPIDEIRKALAEYDWGTVAEAITDIGKAGRLAGYRDVFARYLRIRLQSRRSLHLLLDGLRPKGVN